MGSHRQSVKHPAKFSPSILKAIDKVLSEFNDGFPVLALDPFAGVGLVHQLKQACAVGVELEPEWAMQHPLNIVGNALYLPFANGTFGLIVTSPVYGNRASDHHDAKDESTRHTYRHYLGRKLHPENSGQLQWGPAYRQFHYRAWKESARVLADDGLFVINCSDHVRGDQRQNVMAWHEECMGFLGFELIRKVAVKTPRLRHGQNHRTRMPREYVLVFAAAA